MMRFDMKVSGLDGLRRASALAPRQFNIVLRDAIKTSAIQMRYVMIEEVKAFAVDARFQESIRYRLSGLSAAVGSLAPTALSIEMGRRPGEVVKIGLIRRWIVARGIVRGLFSLSREPKSTIGHRSLRFAGVANAEIAEAIRIVKLIRERGTTPKLYGQRTVERSRDRILDNFRSSMHKALRGLAQMQRRAA